MELDSKRCSKKLREIGAREGTTSHGHNPGSCAHDHLPCVHAFVVIIIGVQCFTCSDKEPTDSIIPRVIVLHGTESHSWDYDRNAEYMR